MSDLHFEYHSDRGESWIRSLDSSNVDVLILAGDIAEINQGGLSFALARFCDRYPQVVFVPGNHEYYGSSIEEAEHRLDELEASYNLLHILRGDAVDINGQRFVGATLWFTDRDDSDHEAWTLRLNDFKMIKGGFESWVYSQADREAQFLMNTIQSGDVVVTHHIPSKRGVAERWQNSIEGFGRFFVHELPESLVTKARLWCHGHGHDSVQTTIGDHLLVANPFGYLNVEENPRFNPCLFFDL